MLTPEGQGIKQLTSNNGQECHSARIGMYLLRYLIIEWIVAMFKIADQKRCGCQQTNQYSSYNNPLGTTM